MSELEAAAGCTREKPAQSSRAFKLKTVYIA